MKSLADDKTIHDLVKAEAERQRSTLTLIPSENYVSRAVLEAIATVYTNKYSEGFPGQRYYSGQINTDKIESLAIERAKALFKADHANVQVNSGAPANEAVYSAWCEPGDTIMGMELKDGGHLSHGRPGTFMARVFNFVRYGIKDIETGEIDYEGMRATAIKEQPKIIIAGYSSYPRELDYAQIKSIADEVGAVAMADVSHIAGLIAAGQLANPFEAGFQVLTTTTHKTLRGPRGALILSKGEVSNPFKEPEKTIQNLPTLIDRAVFPGIQGGPHMNVVLAKAVALKEASMPDFKDYCQQTLLNAKALAAALMERGFKLVTNGTDNHLVLVDTIRSFGLDGKVVEVAIEQAGLTVNKNVIPNDPLPPFKPSGIRLGTPALTTRGLRVEHMPQIADWMLAAIQNYQDAKKLTSISKEVSEFCLEFPLPSDV